jgi:glucan phosphorylase
VNGVAQLNNDILKSELFANYVSIWPTKFQNKTNGITPRRWLSFCSPELSQIITKGAFVSEIRNLFLGTKTGIKKNTHVCFKEISNYSQEFIITRNLLFP